MSADRLERAFASTAAVLAKVNAEQFDDPTPCASWRVRDLINHVVGGTTFFAVTAETGTSPGRGSQPTDFTVGDYRASYQQGAQRAVTAFRAEGAMDALMSVPFGQLPGSVFVNIAATDAFVHGWDLAKATGQSTDLDPELAGQLLASAQRSFPDTMRGDDGKAPFGAPVEVAESAAAADRLAGFLGRQP
ncbi:MAG TPA: TIGR03086 family metal-binding protein [Mycobacteriales bacterium]|nr:TIGR03086 family metal-binding protein [Mycobacteriales bacterium]